MCDRPLSQTVGEEGSEAAKEDEGVQRTGDHTGAFSSRFTIPVRGVRRRGKLSRNESHEIDPPVYVRVHELSGRQQAKDDIVGAVGMPSLPCHLRPFRRFHSMCIYIHRYCDFTCVDWRQPDAQQTMAWQ